jgi:pyrrolidone-carboxylate peptidase
MKNILVVGLKPFGPYKTNLSEKIITKLDGRVLNINNMRFQICGKIIPINFKEFREKIEDAVKKVKPVVAVGTGMDFKDLSHLSFELEAHKKPNYGLLTDSLGNTCPDNDLDSLSDILRIPNSKDIIPIINEINGIEISENAGRWICETIFRDLIRLSDNGKKFQPSFVHVPHTKELLNISKKLEEHRKWMDLDKQEDVLFDTITKITEYYMFNCN